MKNFGICLMIAGVIWGVYAFNMKTSIETEGRTVGNGTYSLYVPGQNIHNLDLAARKQNHLLGAGVTVIAGVILLGFGSLQKTSKSSDESATKQTSKYDNIYTKAIVILISIAATAWFYEKFVKP
ncbi:hypothetical protein [Geobacter sp.]|uniref:hypothetical protein n=1 Tax=Geobacter sp. TaxID=46610 RepID=UPI002619D467|nr:hypothetical protein [Geobacter sp.]